MNHLSDEEIQILLEKPDWQQDPGYIHHIQHCQICQTSLHAYIDLIQVLKKEPEYLLPDHFSELAAQKALTGSKPKISAFMGEILLAVIGFLLALGTMFYLSKDTNLFFEIQRHIVLIFKPIIEYTQTILNHLHNVSDFNPMIWASIGIILLLTFLMEPILQNQLSRTKKGRSLGSTLMMI